MRGSTPKHIQHELSKLVIEAIAKNIIDPGDVEDYLLENGWTMELPARQTIINVLNRNGVEFVSGYWSKVKK
jgi:hypothetical protein